MSIAAVGGEDLAGAFERYGRDIERTRLRLAGNGLFALVTVVRAWGACAARCTGAGHYNLTLVDEKITKAFLQGKNHPTRKRPDALLKMLAAETSRS